MRSLRASNRPPKEYGRQNLNDKCGIIHLTRTAWPFWRSVAFGRILSLGSVEQAPIGPLGRIESDRLKSPHTDLAIPGLSIERICWHCVLPDPRKTNNLRHRYTFGTGH